MLSSHRHRVDIMRLLRPDDKPAVPTATIKWCIRGKLCPVISGAELISLRLLVSESPVFADYFSQHTAAWIFIWSHIHKTRMRGPDWNKQPYPTFWHCVCADSWLNANRFPAWFKVEVHCYNYTGLYWGTWVMTRNGCWCWSVWGCRCMLIVGRTGLKI